MTKAKAALAIFLMVLPILVKAQYSYTDGGDGTAIITGVGNNPSQRYDIPSSINGLTVVGIGVRAFDGDLVVRYVTIPSTVTNISNKAFYGCKNLSSLTLSTNIVSFGAWAFADCASLTNVVIPDKTTAIGGNAFSYCTQLANLTIGTNVVNIPGGAFFGCSSLSNVVMSSAVTNIGDSAFGRSKLSSVQISSNTVSIGETAFVESRSLTSFSVDTNNLVYISTNGVIFKTTYKTLVKYPSGLGGAYTPPVTVSNIAPSAFFGCSTLTNITLGTNIVSIGPAAFAGCAGLKTLVITNGTKVLAASAFSGCSGLTNVYVAASITNLPDYAFNGATGLVKVTFGGAAPGIGATNVFGGNTNFTVLYPTSSNGWSTSFAGAPTAAY